MTLAGIALNVATGPPNEVDRHIIRDVVAAVRVVCLSTRPPAIPQEASNDRAMA
jgi:hypothetical protein